jgi:hypothetical protein
VARGLAAVGSSPPFLLSALLGVLALWLVYASTGVIRIATPGLVAQIEALPPIQSALDANFFEVGTRVFSAASNVTIAIGLLVLRAVTVAFWVSMALEWFEHGSQGMDAARAAARRVRSAFRTVVGVQAALMVIMVALAILSPLLGQLLLPLLFVVPLYFLVFTPIVAVREATTVRRSFALALAGARLRGPQHAILVFAYGFLTIVLLVATSGSVATPVTPTLVVWAYILLTNVVHVGMLAAFSYRWLLVRDVVIASGAGEPRERRSLRRPSPSGLR